MKVAPHFSIKENSDFRAARAARFAVNRGYYRQIYQAIDPLTRAHIAMLFDKGSAERRSS